MESKYTKELLKPIIKKSFSWAQVCRELELKPATGSQTHIKSRAVKLRINFSHFTGLSWSKGKILSPRKLIEKYLIKGINISSDRLKKRLFKEKIKEKKCEKCSLDKWFDEELPLELDHKNGDSTDNRLENLMVLCPNCHAIKTRKDRQKK